MTSDEFRVLLTLALVCGALGATVGFVGSTWRTPVHVHHWLAYSPKTAAVCCMCRGGK